MKHVPFGRSILIFIFGLALSIVGIGYWRYSEHYVSTEDAYVNANVVQVAARVTGQVAHLYVVNNQYVKKGEVLFELDTAPFLVARDKAKAQLAIRQANWQDAKVTAARVVALVQQKVMPPQAQDDAFAKLESASAAVKLAQSNLAQAELNLQYTVISMPTSGWITNMTLREGNQVEANQPLFALISDSEFWIDANFKETRLERVRPGQKAVIEVDNYPNHPFKGVVESISGGSGTAFSLLPSQNATGNWVKITQRVPVRVRVLDVDEKYPLRIGTTATVTIQVDSSHVD